MHIYTHYSGSNSLHVLHLKEGKIALKTKLSQKFDELSPCDPEYTTIFY